MTKFLGLQLNPKFIIINLFEIDYQIKCLNRWFIFFVRKLYSKLIKQKKLLFNFNTQFPITPIIKMSQNRRTYSPLSHTYSYSTTYSPTYSYSRVGTYLDALERDQTLTKLKRDLNGLKSVQMRYQALLQEIALAEKQNRMLENKNSQIEQQYVDKIQQTKIQVNQLESKLNTLSMRLGEEEKHAEEVQKQVEMLVEELKKLKMEDELLEGQNKQLQCEVQKCNNHLSKLTKQQQQMIAKKSSLHKESKDISGEMQTAMKSLTDLNSMIQQYDEQLVLLQNQSKKLSLETQHIETIFRKNTALIQNLERKVSIQQGENQQVKTELNQAIEAWQKMQKQTLTQKQSLYENIIKVEEKSMILKETLSELDKILQSDSTQKKYLRDISSKLGKLSGENQQLRQVLKLLKASYAQKKVQETTLIDEINEKMKMDEVIRQGIQTRMQQMSKLKEKLIH